MDQYNEKQIFNIFQERAVEHDPVKRLWTAVLCRTVLDMVKNNKANKLAAVNWVRIDDDFGFNSFNNVCDILDLDPDRARKIILSERLKLVWLVKGEDFNMIKDAAKYYNVACCTISAWCNGVDSKNGRYRYDKRQDCGRELRYDG